jgi:hypothetical protein
MLSTLILSGFSSGYQTTRIPMSRRLAKRTRHGVEGRFVLIMMDCEFLQFSERILSSEEWDVSNSQFPGSHRWPAVGLPLAGWEKGP